jgi:hypothetical protein
LGQRDDNLSQCLKKVQNPQTAPTSRMKKQSYNGKGPNSAVVPENIYVHIYVYRLAVSGGDETKWKTQQKMERRGRKGSSSARSEEMDRVGNR